MTDPTPQDRAQSVLRGLALIRGSMEGIQENGHVMERETLADVVDRVLIYAATAEAILEPLAYPRSEMLEVTR